MLHGFTIKFLKPLIFCFHYKIITYFKMNSMYQICSKIMLGTKVIFFFGINRKRLQRSTILFYINRSDQDFSIFLYIFLSFEAVLTFEVYYMNFQCIRIHEKAHIISDFRKKNLLGWGSNPQKWLLLCHPLFLSESGIVNSF